MNKCHIKKYYDWWFDNAIEFVGHLLEQHGIDVIWEDGIIFDSLNKNQITAIVEEIERLIPFKLKYQTVNNNGLSEEKNRAYFPTMHRGKYVSFLGKAKNDKITILTSLLCDNTANTQNNICVCDICRSSYNEDFAISKVSQSIYPVVIGSLSSQCGIRKVNPSYTCCPLCAVLGCLEWLDDIPFSCDHGNLIHYYIFPYLDDMHELHVVKGLLRKNLTQKPYSNIFSSSNTQIKNEYALLMLLYENLYKNAQRIVRFKNITCNNWISLRINGTDAKYQTKYTYQNNIRIPNIKNLERIYTDIKEPYSNFVDKSSATPLKKKDVSKKIKDMLTDENKYCMSKGIILDDFKEFSKAFQVRQNCSIDTPKELLDKIIELWRGY